SVSRPEVIMREEGGRRLEPYERVVADVPVGAMGSVVQALAERKGTLTSMEPGETRARLEFRVPSRGLFGFRTSFLSMTQGEGLLSHVFDGYEPYAGELHTRSHGSRVAMEPGEAFASQLTKLEDRGSVFSSPGTGV